MPAFAQDTIKVGALHLLSGTMAISETVLKDTVLMAIDEINAKGGVLGKKLEPVVVDPASNWPLFAEKARQLISKDKVAVTFGCWTSVSRKSVLPVYEERNSLLFYPVQYEGEEPSMNVFYTGAAPNQQAIPAVQYLMSKDGGSAKRFVLLGTDDVYPRTTNKTLRSLLHSKGIKDEDIMEDYTPFGHADYQGISAKIKKFAFEGKKTAVVSTINGDSNVPFYKELGNQGLKASGVPDFAHGVALYLDDITVSFDGFKALNKLTLTVNVGELRCIIGPNGAGKTTMMDCITGKTRPDSGKAFFGSTIDLLRLTEPQIAQIGIGRKFQKPTVYEELSVFENLELALAADRRVRASLFSRLTGSQLDHIGEVLSTIHLKPDARRTAGLLSHGQKQWLEIGMLLVQEPKLLLLDEPVAGMTDEETERTAELFCRAKASTAWWWWSTT